MTAKKTFQVVLSVAIALFFLWLILRRISLEQIKHAFDGASLIWILAALVAFAIGYSCRIERCRLMLERDNPRLKWRSCAGPLLASFAVNNILPFRAGDVLRSFAFNRRLGTTTGVMVATLFVERLLDLLMVLVLLSVTLAFFDMEASRFAGVGSMVLTFGATAILVVLLFPGVFASLAQSVGRLAARLSPRVGQKLHDEISKGLDTLQYLAKGNTMIGLIAWSVMAWLAEGCVFWFSALALPSIAAPLAGWLALPVGTLATLIPSTPGYVGTFDYFTVHAMTELGNTFKAATAYTLLVHVLLWLPPTLVGGLYLLLHPVKQQEKLKAI